MQPSKVSRPLEENADVDEAQNEPTIAEVTSNDHETTTISLREEQGAGSNPDSHDDHENVC